MFLSLPFTQGDQIETTISGWQRFANRPDRILVPSQIALRDLVEYAVES